ncbi:hypothetical protein ABZ342_43180 [Amycolatopsis sp. NPDC005961]|uniref:hypothetical protein n=1 Tax=Amycolatopsis sp. NPDC005961 TaxID=3156720 RepID=UPI0033E90138
MPGVVRRAGFRALGVVAVTLLLGFALHLSRPEAPVSPPEVPSLAAVPARGIDREWELSGARVGDDGTGFFTGEITVTNQAGRARTGLFRLTLSVGGRQVANLVGRTESAVAPGVTVVVELGLGGAFVPGPYAVEFHEAFA